MTAYFVHASLVTWVDQTDIPSQGIFDIGRLKNGDNVVVSGAAGSVGLVDL
jgi:NADPH-dependent curcumin reductase CurA